MTFGETGVDPGRHPNKNRLNRPETFTMERRALMNCPMQFVRSPLVWLAAAMLPLQPALVLAGCCGKAVIGEKTETEHHGCCGHVASSSLPANCDCSTGCHGCCPQNGDQPASATTASTTPDRPGSQLSPSLPAAGATHRSTITVQRGGVCPATAALTSVQRCVSLSKLQL